MKQYWVGQERDIPRLDQRTLDEFIPASRSADLTTEWSELEILAEAEAVVNLGCWAWNIEADQLWWSDETYRIFGLKPQEFPATYEGFLGGVHPEDQIVVDERVRAAVAGEAAYDIRHRVVRPTGEILHVHEHGRVTRSADGSPMRMIGTVRDVTAEVELQQQRDAAIRALSESEQRHRLLAQNAWDIVWVMTPDAKVTYVSPSVERVRGFTPEEATVQTVDETLTPESAARVGHYFAELYYAREAGTEIPGFQGELQYYHKDGSIMLGELQVIPHVDQDGRLIELLGVTRDISERRKFEEQLNRLAVTDPLTGVWNRRYGEELFTADLAEARRYGPPVSLLVLDIDHFKAINDTHGHQVGDQVLMEFCERLVPNLRSTDTLVRWGGDEFVIVMRHCSIDECVPLADKIRVLISAQDFQDVGQVTVSIGAAELRGDDDLASWLDRADRAALEAKVVGRDCVREAS